MIVEFFCFCLFFIYTTYFNNIMVKYYPEITDNRPDPAALKKSVFRKQPNRRPKKIVGSSSRLKKCKATRAQQTS